METNWNNVASWYDEYLKGEDTYQEKVILPNLMRMLALIPNMEVLDVACGQGYFTKACASFGVTVTGIDQSDALLAIASKDKTGREEYIHGNAEQVDTFINKTYDRIFSVLALENIANIQGMMQGMARLMKNDGSMVLVLLHPSFRIPKHTDWGYSMRKGEQYRMVYKYLSEVSIPIVLNPFKGAGKEEATLTFHRSLQWYMKAFKNAGLAITSIEEWISHKKSAPGLRQKAEDNSRKEIPMFIAIELKKLS